MDGDLELGPFHIPTLSELFPAPEKRIPAVAPRGTETCLEGDVFYVGSKSGGYHVNSLQDMKKIIRDHGGRIGRTIIPSHTYVIGVSPHQDFMETIANYKKRTFFQKKSNEYVMCRYTLFTFEWMSYHFQ